MVVRENIIVIILGGAFAEEGKFAPGVEAEHTSCDDRCQVKAAANTTAAASHGTSVEEPGTQNHQGRVGGQEEHNGGTESVHDIEAVAILPARIFIITIKVSTTFVGNVSNVISSVIKVVTVPSGGTKEV